MLELIIYMFAMAITPGPNTIASLVNASQNGLKKGIYLNYGMLAGIAFVATISFLLIRLLDTIIPRLLPILQFLGGIYIVYIAIHYLRKGTIAKLDSVKGSFKTGFIMQLANLKVMILCISAITSFIIPMGYSWTISYLIALTLPVCCFFCGLIWAFFGQFISEFYIKHNTPIRCFLSVILLLLAIDNFYQLFFS